jgi:hypothetical protein
MIIKEYKWNEYSSKKEISYKILSDDVNYLNDNTLNNINLLDFYNLFYIDKKNILNECKIEVSRYNKNSIIGYIYLIENIMTGKKYIGRTINPLSRLTSHIFNSSNYELKNDLIKYGLYNFNYKSYLSNNYKEQEFIEMKNHNDVYNITK